MRTRSGEFCWRVIILVALGLACQIALAQQADHKSSKKQKASASATQADIQALRDALAQQQQQIQQLSDELEQKEAAWEQAQQQLHEAQQASSDARSKTETLEGAATQTSAAVTKLQGDVADVKSSVASAALATQDQQKKLASVEGVIGRFRWSGDVRVRGESFFQSYGGCAACVDRNRARIRVRFGFESKLGEDFTAGVALASGFDSNGAPSFTNAVSTDETLTSFFEKKTIGLDRGYIAYNPHQAEWLTLTGGKFAYDWPRTSLTLDPDLNPEGFTERAAWSFNNSFLKNVNFEGMELLFNEVAGGPAGLGVNRGVDSNALGGSFSAKLQLGKYWSMTPSYTNLHWNGADAIAQASLPVLPCATAKSTNCIAEPNTPAVGTPLPSLVAPAPLVINANAMTNATYIRGTGAGQTRAFVSGFDYSDFILDNTIKTPWERFPWHLKAEYEKNLRAKLNIGLAPSRQDQAYGFDTNFGALKNRHDLQVGYLWTRIEQDAVISQFDESDLRAPTNVLQNRLYVNWLVKQNVTASFNDFIGRTLNRNLQNSALAPGLPKGQQDPYLNRLQFDLVYKF